MPWNESWPNGAVSVADNATTGQENTTYIKTKMNLDHYWGAEGDEDGHHKFVQCPKSETGGTPTDPTVATGMDGALYLKQKESADSDVHQPVVPFFKDGAASPAILEMLGIRVCSYFSVDGAGAITQLYKHNLTSVTGAGGAYVATFPQLPSANYFVFGGGIAKTAAAITPNKPLSFSIRGSSAASNVKTDTSFVFETVVSGALQAPLECWFIVFGG